MNQPSSFGSLERCYCRVRIHRADSAHLFALSYLKTRTGLRKMNRYCVHLGSKSTRFARWADNRPLCLKHTGNLAHFSCKCPDLKPERQPLGGIVISVVCKTATCNSMTMATMEKKTQAERNRYLRFVSPRNVTLVLDSDTLKYLHFDYKYHILIPGKRGKLDVLLVCIKLLYMICNIIFITSSVALLTGAVEYGDCTFAEG